MQIVHTGEGSTWAHIVLNHFTVFARSAIDDKSEFLHIIWQFWAPPLCNWVRYATWHPDWDFWLLPEMWQKLRLLIMYSGFPGFLVMRWLLPMTIDYSHHSSIQNSLCLRKLQGCKISCQIGDANRLFCLMLQLQISFFSFSIFSQWAMICVWNTWRRELGLLTVAHFPRIKLF